MGEKTVILVKIGAETIKEKEGENKKSALFSSCK